METIYLIPKTQNVHGNLSEDHYKKAITILEKKYGKNLGFFVFSDDSNYVEQAYSFIDNKVIVTGNDLMPHEDMYLMSQCNHHIIANSSFSWWGAWLNPSKDKTVIAPQNWFSPQMMKKKSTKDLIPKDWMQI